MAGPPGFEPGMRGSKPRALPLGDGPFKKNTDSQNIAIQNSPSDSSFSPSMCKANYSRALLFRQPGQILCKI